MQQQHFHRKICRFALYAKVMKTMTLPIEPYSTPVFGVVVYPDREGITGSMLYSVGRSTRTIATYSVAMYHQVEVGGCPLWPRRSGHC